jgi:hypothetical protein
MSVHLRKLSWIISLSCSLAFITLAGPGPDKMASVRITTMSTFRPTVAGQGEIHRYLTRWFEAQGVKVVDNAEWVVWFNALTVDELDSSRVVLAIGLGHTLPKEAIDLGKKSEVFYSSLPTATKASLPADGKWVREYITEGFLYEFFYPLDEKLVVVPREKLLERLDELVTELCARQLKG